MLERVNDDFNQPVALNVDDLPWQASPTPGVERKLLDRVGGEVARATSVVRFLPGHSFPAHTHGGGEEFLVLSGMFSDEAGDFGRLSYVRNAPGSAHRPYSDEGAEIFVKLCQMRPNGERSLVVRAEDVPWSTEGLQAGVRRKLLYSATGWREEVALEAFEGALARPTEVFEQGAEILVLEGVLFDQGVPHTALSWLRYPNGGRAVLHADGPVLYWIKRGILFPEDG